MGAEDDRDSRKVRLFRRSPGRVLSELLSDRADEIRSVTVEERKLGDFRAKLER